MKERIIGAAVLVLFVVLVVPIFLDGPPSEDEVVSERVLLPGQELQETQTVVLDRNRTEPVPAASTQSKESASAPEPEAKPSAKASAEPRAETPKARQEKPVETNTTQVTKKQPEPSPKDVVAKAKPQVSKAPAASTTGMWAVQLGSFSSKENAENLAADLRKKGYAAFLSQLSTDSGQLHRVRIGPQKDRESAEEMAGRLRKVGQEGQVVPHP